MTIKVYGASDDLIEVDGSIREEFSAHGDDERHLLAFSTGHVVECRYDDDGCWRVSLIAGAEAIVYHDPAAGADANERDDGTPGYSDVLTIDHSPEWVVYGNAWARS